MLFNQSAIFDRDDSPLSLAKDLDWRNSWPGVASKWVPLFWQPARTYARFQHTGRHEYFWFCGETTTVSLFSRVSLFVSFFLRYASSKEEKEETNHQIGKQADVVVGGITSPAIHIEQLSTAQDLFTIFIFLHDVENSSKREIFEYLSLPVNHLERQIYNQCSAR